MTLRKLVWMAEERARGDWATTATIVCKIHDGFRAWFGGDPLEPWQVHPILAGSAAPREPEIRMTMGELGDMIGRNLGPGRQ